MGVLHVYLAWCIGLAPLTRYGAEHGVHMRRFFGSDNITFSVGSEYAPVKFAPRTYTSFTEAALEVGLSRCCTCLRFCSC